VIIITRRADVHVEITLGENKRKEKPGETVGAGGGEHTHTERIIYYYVCCILDIFYVSLRALEAKLYGRLSYYEPIEWTTSCGIFRNLHVVRISSATRECFFF